jgi:hypothetical protein
MYLYVLLVYGWLDYVGLQAPSALNPSKESLDQLLPAETCQRLPCTRLEATWQLVTN